MAYLDYMERKMIEDNFLALWIVNINNSRTEAIHRKDELQWRVNAMKT